MKLILLSGGLFQVYSNPIELFISYNDIYQKTLEFNSSFYSNLNVIFEKYYQITQMKKEELLDLERLNNKFLNEINLGGRRSLTNLFEGKKDNFETIVLQYFYDFLDKFNEVYFNYENLLFLLIDYNIFKLLDIKTEKIKFILNIKLEEENIPPTKCLVCDNDLSNLYYYHSLGCFTIFLAHLVKMSLSDEKEKLYVNEINCKNIDFLEKNGIFFDFSFTFMIQGMNYINYMDNYENDWKEVNGRTLSEKIINRKGSYNVLVIYRFFFLEKEMQRAQFFICSDKILYSTYIGNHFTNCYYYLNKYYLSRNYSRIDSALCKMFTSCCLTTYSQLIKDLSRIRRENPEIFFSTNPENIEICLTRGLLNEIIKKLISEINSDKLLFPITYEVPFIAIDSYKDFTSFLTRNNLRYPLMLKFDGPQTKYDHLQINLISEQGINNSLNYLREFIGDDDKNKIKVVIQEFIQHGGNLIKLYRIKNENFIYYRPSLPNIREEMTNTLEEYHKGFFCFETKEMGTQKFKEFWLKTNCDSINFEKIVNKEFLGKVAEKYSNVYGDSLVGLDFIMDTEKEIYYLIDINPFPAYSELYNDMNHIFEEHFVSGIKNIKCTRKI